MRSGDQGGVGVGVIVPSRGPVWGGTAVAIRGGGFARRAAELGYTRARFNMTRVPTVWESSSELRAVVPEHAAGLVSVAVTQNDQQYSGSLHFEYEDVAPHSIAPRAGPLRGGTTVVLRGGSVHGGGLGVGGAHGAFCKFSGLDVVGASFDGEGSARCLTPRALRPGAVGVRLVQGEAVLVTSVSFVYHADLAVQSVEPVVGLLGGGTRVIVRGHGFDPSTPLVVRVGLRAVVSGRVLSSTMLECTTPSQMLPGPLALEVSQNAQDFTTDEVLFEYQGGLRLAELAPSRGPPCVFISI